MRVLISQTLLGAAEKIAEGQAPYEACGLLLGACHAGASELLDLVQSPNLTSDDPCLSFEIDPRIQFDLARAARAGGRAVIGVWHSHPVGPPVPSAVDQARSCEPGWVWLITGRSGGRWSSKVFIADHRCRLVPAETVTERAS